MFVVRGVSGNWSALFSLTFPTIFEKSGAKFFDFYKTYVANIYMCESY